MSGRKGFALILGHAVLIQIILYAMRPALSYAALGAGSPPIFLGVLSAAFAVPALFLALPAGHALDRMGERAGLTVGAVFVTAAAVLALMAGSSLPLLVLATVVLGVGQLLSVIGEQSYVGNSTQADRSDSAFGYYGFAASLGQTIGPLLIALPGGTASTPPLRLIFLCCVGAAVAMLVLSLCVPRGDRSSESTRTRNRMIATAGRVLSTPGLPRALIASSMVLASVDIFVAYAPLLGRDRHLGAAIISVMLVARSAFSMLSRLALGRLSRALGRRTVLVWSIFLSAISLGLLALPVSPIILIVIAAAYGFSVGICQPITMSWISVLAPPGTRGLAMSLRLATNRLGQTTIPTTLGLVSAATGAAGVLVSTGAMLLLATWSSAAIAPGPKR